jgi:hypothetical protein
MIDGSQVTCVDDKCESDHLCLLCHGSHPLGDPKCALASDRSRIGDDIFGYCSLNALVSELVRGFFGAGTVLCPLGRTRLM